MHFWLPAAGSRHPIVCTVLLAGLCACRLVHGTEAPVNTAHVLVSTGPAAGTYTFTSSDACVLAPLRKGVAPTFAHIFMSPTSTLSLDIPNIAQAHINEFQVELVVAVKGADRSRLRTASSTLTIDTRPDASLEPYQRQERGKSGPSGRGSIKWHAGSATVRLEFQGETPGGVRMSGSVECRKVDGEFGR